VKPPATTHVSVEPIVISKMLHLQHAHPENEVGALLLGRADANVLYVMDLVPAENVGTAINVTFTAADFERANRRKKPRQFVVGWAHTHPTYTAFMSSTDQRHQRQGQELFADYVGLVLDMFHRDGIQFRFFRVENNHVVQIPHNFRRKQKCNTRAKSSSKAGTRKKSTRFERVLSGVVRSAHK
jgi:proteasome lid subunit RPN8/RPN11